MRANYLSKKEAAELAERIKRLTWGRVLGERRLREALEVEESGLRLYRVGPLLVAEKEDALFPILGWEGNSESLNLLPSIIVDMGAVPHIANGADVMRPGVRGFKGEFMRGDILVVRDEVHGKPIAIARALEDVDRCREMRRGKVAETLHYVDDKIWKLLKRARHVIEKARA